MAMPHLQGLEFALLPDSEGKASCPCPRSPTNLAFIPEALPSWGSGPGGCHGSLAGALREADHHFLLHTKGRAWGLPKPHLSTSLSALKSWGEGP